MWDELMGKLREDLRGGQGNLQELMGVLGRVAEGGGALDEVATGAALGLLTLTVTNLYNAVDRVAVGLDSVVIALREAETPQEVKGD